MRFKRPADRKEDRESPGEPVMSVCAGPRRGSASRISAAILIALSVGLACGCYDMGVAFYPAQEASDRMEAGAGYTREKKWAEAEREYTRAIIAWKRAIDQHVNRDRKIVRSQSQYSKDWEDYNSLSRERAIAFFNRGVALKNQGDLHCARMDFARAMIGVYGREKENAERMRDQMHDVISRTGRKGRADCPPSE